MLFAAFGLRCFRAPPADGIGDPMPEALQRAQQVARKKCALRGRTTSAVEHSLAMLPAARVARTATSPHRKWRCGPTFRAEIQWRLNPPSVVDRDVLDACQPGR